MKLSLDECNAIGEHCMNATLFLQGLVPRAKQLLALGLTFVLAFGPVILAISLLFSGIFWVRFSSSLCGHGRGVHIYIHKREVTHC